MNFQLKLSLFCLFLGQIPDVMYQILDKPMSRGELQGRLDNIPQTLEDFMAEIKESKPDAKTFALKLREMVIIPHLFIYYCLLSFNLLKHTLHLKNPIMLELGV